LSVVSVGSRRSFTTPLILTQLLPRTQHKNLSPRSLVKKFVSHSNSLTNIIRTWRKNKNLRDVSLQKSCVLKLVEMKLVENINSIFKNERVKSFVFWCAGLIVLDQIFKLVIFSILNTEQIFSVGDQGVIGIKLFENAHFAFSLPLPIYVIYLIYFLALLLISIYVVKHFNLFLKKELFAWLLIFAGAISNIAERIIRGSVRDYLYIYGDGILNLADLYILFGILSLLYLEIKPKIFKKN
jgi:signal peptidase II